MSLNTNYDEIKPNQSNTSSIYPKNSFSIQNLF